MWVRHLSLIVMTFIVSNASSRSYFTIVDDDASSIESIASIKEMSDLLGIKAVFAPIAYNLELHPEIAATLSEYQSQGFGIVNHSYSHDINVWSKGDSASILDDLDKAKNILNKYGLNGSEYIVYPYGRFSKDRRAEMSRWLKNNSKLAINSRGDVNNLGGIDRFYISRFPLRKHENLSIVKWKIDKAISDSVWIVFLTHSANSFDTDTAYIAEVVRHCLSKGLECITVDQAYNGLIINAPCTIDNRSDGVISEISRSALMHLWYILAALFILAIPAILLLHIGQKKHKCHT